MTGFLLWNTTIFHAMKSMWFKTTLDPTDFYFMNKKKCIQVLNNMGVCKWLQNCHFQVSYMNNITSKQLFGAKYVDVEVILRFILMTDISRDAYCHSFLLNNLDLKSWFSLKSWEWQIITESLRLSVMVQFNFYALYSVEKQLFPLLVSCIETQMNYAAYLRANWTVLCL